MPLAVILMLIERDARLADRGHDGAARGLGGGQGGEPGGGHAEVAGGCRRGDRVGGEDQFVEHGDDGADAVDGG
jgi:hypothetical protein